MSRTYALPLGVLSFALALACGGGGGGDGGSVIEEASALRESPSVEVFEASGYIAHAESNLPIHFSLAVPGFENVFDTDNTPADNPLTNEGAALGRVLFYDRNLSANRRVSCSSCHLQKHGFSDPDRFSRGFDGGRTDRHSPGLTQARYYERGLFFWDERANSLEEQVLQPIENEVEMGLTLDDLVVRLQDLPHYGTLFEEAFGSAEINVDRISKAMAQFIRSMVSYESKFDSAFSGNLEPDFASALTEEELLGLDLFRGRTGVNGKAIRCDACHLSVAQVSRQPENIGLDIGLGDDGAGGGAFKAPSLRNVARRSPFMHDGRFDNLEKVIEHYNSGIQDHPDLNRFLRDEEGQPLRLQFTQEEKSSLVAFLRTLTDENFLTNPLFSNPFPRQQGRTDGDQRGENDRENGDRRPIPNSDQGRPPQGPSNQNGGPPPERQPNSPPPGNPGPRRPSPDQEQDQE